MVNRDVAVYIYLSSSEEYKLLIQFLRKNNEVIIPGSTLFYGRGVYLVFDGGYWLTSGENDGRTIVSIKQFIGASSPIEHIYG